MGLVAAAGWVPAALVSLALWRAVVRLRQVRAAGLAAVAEAIAWRGRAFAAEENARLARADGEKLRAAYARLVGLARRHRYGDYPAQLPSPTE